MFHLELIEWSNCCFCYYFTHQKMVLNKSFNFCFWWKEFLVTSFVLFYSLSRKTATQKTAKLLMTPSFRFISIHLFIASNTNKTIYDHNKKKKTNSNFLVYLHFFFHTCFGSLILCTPLFVVVYSFTSFGHNTQFALLLFWLALFSHWFVVILFYLNK